MPTSELNVPTSHALDSASNGAHQVIDRTAQVAHPAVDQLASNAHRAVDKAASGANRAAESLESSGARLRAAQTQVTDGLRAFVREQPVASLGIAVGVGIVLSAMLRRQ